MAKAARLIRGALPRGWCRGPVKLIPSRLPRCSWGISG